MKSVNNVMENYVQKLEEVICDFFKKPEMHNSFITDIREVVLQIGIELVVGAFEEMDATLRMSSLRRKNWTIVKKDAVSLLTTLGSVSYEKTLFINKDTQERAYLLDRLLGVEKHARMTEDVEEAILEEAIDSTYKKTGKMVCITEDHISKETVMNKIHGLQFPEEKFIEKKVKKEVSILYIDADEAHIPLQYIREKGDIEKGKRNIAEPKLVYVYEGIDQESKSSTKLINPYYFGGIYEGRSEIENLWSNIYSYIDSKYDISKIQKIYLNGDAGSWIKTGVEYLPKTDHVLDGYHLIKYVNQSVIYAKNKAEDYYKEIIAAIRNKHKKHLVNIFEDIVDLIDDKDEEVKNKKIETIVSAKTYLVGNFNAAHLRLCGDKRICGSSTEPHVSHIYSRRMGMRPMGWCKLGVDRMSRLIIYCKNGHSVSELVKYQKRDVPTIDREAILSQFDVRMMEKELKSDVKDGKYYENLQVMIPLEIRKSLLWKSKM